MKRYVALLRGINISGKNKISMAELKNEFGKLDFEEVKTYLNSGNVIFSSDAVFWSFSRKDYQKTNWWPKTASANISTKLTIRTANTVRKIVSM